ncbi:MAG: hypothetical protein M1829_002917 [Trizodia sp. TS-e1964]|nr:MAG: hypothetical protein M1829_002917 [Trizodia sp. TS-e1964]
MPDNNGLPRAFLDAAQIAIANGDLGRAQLFTEQAVFGWIILKGDDSPKVPQYRALTQDPSKHELYGISMKWKTAVDDISQGLDPKDPEFYTSSDAFTYQPRRHWLFLAEIVDFGTLVRLQMEIKDISGRTVPLFFYTDGRVSELAPSQVRKGYPAAIFYAQRHTFMNSETGIRHEESLNIKVRLP